MKAGKDAGVLCDDGKPGRLETAEGYLKVLKRNLRGKKKYLVVSLDPDEA
jgi:hypothetical protein